METEENLLTNKLQWKRHREYTVVENALNSTKVALEKAENQCSNLSILERKQRLAKAWSELAAAQETWNVFNRQGVLINLLLGTQ